MIEVLGSWSLVAISAIVPAILIVGIWWYFATIRTRASMEAYQALTARAAEAQEKTSRQLERLAADSAELRDRVAAIEKVLREVE